MGGAASQRLWVFYGAYPSREQAVAAERALPERYRKAFRTGVRSYAELRRPL